MKVTWEPPQHGKFSGFLIEYVLHNNGQVTDENTKKSTVDDATKEKTLTGLKAGCKYCVTVTTLSVEEKSKKSSGVDQIIGK